MKVAYHAAEADDVVSGTIESTEAQSFGKISIDGLMVRASKAAGHDGPGSSF